MRPIALSDEQLTMIMQAVRPLLPRDRGSLLESVARELQDRPTIGDGSLHLIVRELQRRHFDPPNLREAAQAPRVAERTKAR